MNNPSSRIFISGVVLAFTLAMTSTFTACTSKRAEVFTQGQGSGLDDISTWKERSIPLSTGDYIGTAATTHAQDNVVVKDKIMNHFDLVQIKVEDQSLAGLLGNPPFHGRANTTGVYELKIKLTDNYLKFYKVAKPEDLPFEEYAYKEETLADGRIAIPMLGYKISGYYHIEPVKTSDDLDSHHLTEIADIDHSKSTHVRIDWSSREYFQPVKTTDFMPADIFFKKTVIKKDDKDTIVYTPYEWYYAETVIEKSLNDNQTIVGETATRVENSQLLPASKIIFVPRENELRVVNVARDERMSRDQIKNSADLNSEAALIIPVKWAEYRTKSDGKNLSLQGEAIEDRKWDQRGSFEMNIPELKSAGITEGTTRLLDLEVDQNYFSFTVLNMIGNQGRKLHYSFLRADQGRVPYTPRQSFKEDRSLFGFFTSVKPFIPNWEFYTEENFNKRIYMSRMNPDAKEVVFHLSADSPAWLEDIAERAVNAWDKTFAEALQGSGKKMKIRFAKERVQLGDLRYNVIHLVETLNEDGLLGFGPSVADPETGEIISATTNVYVNSTQAIAAGTVRQYMIDRLEKRLKKEATGEAILSASDLSSSNMSTAAKKIISEAKSPVQKQGSGLEKASLDELMKDLRSKNKNNCHFAEEAMLSANDKDIQKYCPEVESVVDRYLGLDVSSREASKANWEKIWNESKDAIKQCSVKMTRGKLLSTLVHEIGHNFGLRHNFYASYDKANFKKSTTIFGEEITAHSSSIMEYTDWDEDRLTETGTYDIAAIRFGYGEQVELKNGSIVKVDPQKKLVNKDLKPYLFCTDEEAYTGLNALCKPHDAGTSPMELVEFYIKGYKRSEALRKLRRAKPMNSDPEMIAGSNYDRVFSPLKDIYDEWRYLLGEYVRKSARYLSDYSAKDYKKMLDGMATDPQFGPIYAQYYQASEKIYNFFKEVAFGANEYCLIEDQGEKRAIELERLRDMMSESTRGAVMIRSCSDAVENADLIQVLAKVLDAKAPKVIQEIGYPINSYRYEKPKTLDDYLGVDVDGYERERFDVVGNEITRFLANRLIHKRMGNYRNILSGFAPNMMDEPTHYNDYLVLLKNRLVDGVDFKQFGFKDFQAIPLFAQESRLLGLFASQLQAGLYTPGETIDTLNRVATARRMAAFNVYQPDPSEEASSFAAVLELNGRIRYAARSENDFYAYNLINKYNQVDELVGLTPSSIYSKIMSATPKAVDLPALTIKDFTDALDVLSRSKKNFSVYTECFSGKTPALAQLTQLIPILLKDYQEAATKDEKAMTDFLNTNLVEYAKKQLKEKEEFLFTQENLKDLSTVMSTCLKDEVAGFEPRKVKRYSKDYEAQKSMILDVLHAYTE